MSFPNINKLNMQTTQPNKNQSLEAKNPKESKKTPPHGFPCGDAHFVIQRPFPPFFSF